MPSRRLAETGQAKGTPRSISCDAIARKNDIDINVDMDPDDDDAVCTLHLYNIAYWASTVHATCYMYMYLLKYLTLVDMIRTHVVDLIFSRNEPPH